MILLKHRTLTVTVFLLLSISLAACAAAPSPAQPAAAPAEAKPAEKLQEIAKDAPAVERAAAPKPTEAPAAAAPVEAPKSEAPAAPPAPQQNLTDAATATPIPLPTEDASFKSAMTQPSLAPTNQPQTEFAVTGSANIPEPTAGLDRAQIAKAEAPQAAKQQGVTAIEPRVVELEFPPSMKLGDSETVRVSLVPSKDGHKLDIEFPGNVGVTKTVEIKRPDGYTVQANAQLSSLNFDIDSPRQTSALPENERVDFRWTISPRQSGQQRLNLELRLVWLPLNGGANIETQLFSRSLNIDVNAMLGLSRGQANTTGLLGLVLGGGMSVLSLVAGRGKSEAKREPRIPLGAAQPNAALVIEQQPNMKFDAEETNLLKALFNRYGRVVLTREFRSGYSGAKTMLALPVKPDGRADAFTIAKIGDRESIQREFENYERYVKDTLPPITARIQEAPLVLPTPNRPTPNATRSGKAVLRYTFIGEPGKNPMSLREAFINQADPALLQKLFDTFGPNWWMQRQPYSFRVAQEYDRKLPTHFVVQPTNEKPGGKILNGGLAPTQANINIGDVVTLKNFASVERRADGSGVSLLGETMQGQPPFRVRLNAATLAASSAYRVIATRESILRDAVRGMDLFELSDPLLKLPSILNEGAQGTQSIIHGDLNLENALVGPGGIVWLIDFATTRDGHTLYDFAHLEADLIARVIAPQLSYPSQLLELERARPLLYALRKKAREIASTCLFNPSQPREYDIALFMTCLGSLKFNNLDERQKHTLYLAAAEIGERL
jgi:hypothetical protein